LLGARAIDWRRFSTKLSWLSTLKRWSSADVRSGTWRSPEMVGRAAEVPMRSRVVTANSGDIINEIRITYAVQVLVQDA